MRNHLFYLFFLSVLSLGSVQAILPPDAEFREPEIRAQRIQARKAYEKRMEARRELAVREYRKTEASIYIPPWDRERVLSQWEDGRVPAAQIPVRKAVPEDKGSRLRLSIILLLLIGSVVAWVKYATREVDK